MTGKCLKKKNLRQDCKIDIDVGFNLERKICSRLTVLSYMKWWLLRCNRAV